MLYIVLAVVPVIIYKLITKKVFIKKRAAFLQPASYINPVSLFYSSHGTSADL